MDLKRDLKDQFHAGLAMLADCVNLCPDDLWTAGQYPRAYWRIALHAAFFTQLYLGQTEADFKPWPGRREDSREMWDRPAYLEPYELPESVESYGRADVTEYIAFVDALVDPIIDTLDLDSTETGFSWYENMSKLSHELMTLRHLQGHVGQLSELLMARGIDIDWVAKSAP